MTNPEAYEGIFGNRALKIALAGFTDKAAFPNSLLISGPQGSGKSTFARLAAMAIACTGEKKPCLRCEACRKISEGISPDVTVIGTAKDRKTIGIEAVRSIRDTAYIHPNDLDVKIYIIKDADLMTVQAQNALLKLFEEPPRGVYFLLLCTTSSGLLATVRSRAPELRTELFGNREMTELLLQNSKKAKELYDSDRSAFERILHMASGSYGEALRLAEARDRRAAAGFDSAEQLLRLLSGSDRAEFLVSMLAAATNRENMTGVLRLMMLAVRDMTAARKCREVPELLFFADASSARAAAAGFSLKSLLDIGAALQSTETQISDTNVNLQTAAIVSAERLWSLK